jgi:dolichyl-phosphate-mannose--protein O-mannosyl transferase
LTKAVATKAAAITSAARDAVVWASFPSQSRIASWNASGTRTAVIGVNGAPGAITAPEATKRVAVVDQTSRRLEIVDTESSSVAASLSVASMHVATVPETQLAWSAGDRSVAIIEPRGASVLGTARLPAPARSVLADPVRHRLVVATSSGLVCVSGRPTFAWRFGSAVTGALMAAFVALIALRLFGSKGAAALAALFITIDGLAFTISRIAMNDSYTTAFMLAAWFCALSALFTWGRGPDEWAARSRPAAMAWLMGAGVFSGLSLASKWVGFYALAAIVLFFLWDALRRGPDGILGVTGSIPGSFVFLVVTLGGVPLGLYMLSYIPYFTLGHSVGDFLKLQQSMYAYHANLRATHPFGARWYGWPFGHKAVFLYLADRVTHRSEIWTIPNIVVLWGGAVGMIVAAARARRTRSVALFVLVGAALAQYLPWTIVTRVTFLYHYLPVVPFLAIALGWWLVCGLKGYRHQRLVAVLITLAAVAFFFAVLPALEGWSVPASVLTVIRHTLPWVLPP